MVTLGAMEKLLGLLRSEGGRDLHRVLVVFLLVWIVESVYDVKGRVGFIERHLITYGGQTTKAERAEKPQDASNDTNATSSHRRPYVGELVGEEYRRDGSNVWRRWCSVWNWTNETGAQGGTAGNRSPWDAGEGLRRYVGWPGAESGEGWQALRLGGYYQSRKSNLENRGDDNGAGGQEGSALGRERRDSLNDIDARFEEAVLAAVDGRDGVPSHYDLGTGEGLRPVEGVLSGEEAAQGLAANLHYPRGKVAPFQPGDFQRAPGVAWGNRSAAVARTSLDESVSVSPGEEAKKEQDQVHQKPRAGEGSGYDKR